jgi:hypothetical protein
MARPILPLFFAVLTAAAAFAQAKRTPPLALATLEKADSICMYGFIDTTGKWAIQPLYTYYPSREITYGFNNGLAVVKNDKYWQIIDSKGATVRPLTGFDFFSSPHDGRIMVNQYGFWDKRGFINDGLWGYVDLSGKVMIVPKYRAAADFSDSLGNVGITHYTVGDAYIDSRGFVHHKPKGVGGSYSDSIAIVQDIRTATTYYFTNRKGEVLDTVINMTIPDRFSEGSVPAKMGAKFGYIGKHGDTLIAPQYDEAAPFHEGLALVKQEGRYGFADTSGRLVIQPRFDQARSFSNGRAAVKMKGKWGFINREGELVIPCTFSYVEDFRK